MPTLGTIFLNSYPNFALKQVLDVDLDNEKRRVPRTQVKWSVTIQTSKGTISTEVHDISGEGAFIRASNPLALGEVFKIFIKMPNLDNPLLVDAQVVWTCNRKFDHAVPFSGMGVKFTQITARDRNLLNEVISTQPYPGNMSQSTESIAAVTPAAFSSTTSSRLKRIRQKARVLPSLASRN